MSGRFTPAMAMILLALLAASSAEAGWEEGVQAFQKGDFQRAAEEFQGYVDQRPEVYQGHYMLGQALSRLKRNQEALVHLRKAYELEPGNPGVQLVLGKAYLDVGQYGDAVGILGKINAASLPKSQQAALHQMLASALDKSGDSERAAAELARAASTSPGDAGLQFQYGSAALKIGDTDTALAAFAKAVQLAPNDVDMQRAYAQALVRKGRTSTGAGKATAYQKAVQAAKVVVAASPKYDDLILLAGAQLGAKQYDAALSTLERASSQNPRDWLPLYYMGQAQTQKSQFRSAESNLQQALDKASSGQDKKTIWKQLGFVYEKQKKYTESIAAYQRADDAASVSRVRKNKETEDYNRQVEAEAEELRKLQEEQDRIKKELQDLPGGPPPR